MYDPCPNYYSKQFGVLRALADADPPSPYPRARLFTHTRIYYFLFEAGSDADEFTRGRRPNRGGKWEKPYGGKPHKNKHRPQWNKPPKHDEPDWCDASAFCDDHSDCNKQYPCKNTYCETSNKFRGKNWPKEGKCVCEGELDAAALYNH